MKDGVPARRFGGRTISATRDATPEPNAKMQTSVGPLANPKPGTPASPKNARPHDGLPRETAPWEPTEVGQMILIRRNPDAEALAHSSRTRSARLPGPPLPVNCTGRTLQNRERTTEE